MLIFLLQTALKAFSTRVKLPCGLSDHDNLVVTVSKNTFGKQKSNKRFYRDWGKFNDGVFGAELREALIGFEGHDCKCFEQTFISLLNLHAPMKNKKQRANHEFYITKTLGKAIMKRSELASKYHQIKNTKNYNNYKKQINFCSKLYKKDRKKFCNNLNIKDITDNKKF